MTEMNKEIQELIAKRYGGTIPCERLRAQQAIQNILAILHPKFDEEAEDEGHTSDAEGYIDEHEWDADTLDAAATALHRHGFGPDSCIKHELGYLNHEDDAREGV